MSPRWGCFSHFVPLRGPGCSCRAPHSFGIGCADGFSVSPTRGYHVSCLATRGCAALRTLATPPHRATLCLCEAPVMSHLRCLRVSAAPMVFVCRGKPLLQRSQFSILNPQLKCAANRTLYIVNCKSAERSTRNA